MKIEIRLALLGAVTLLSACGGGEDGGGGTGCTPGPTAAIAISAAGVTPKAVCVLPGGSVTFTNGDAAAHDIESGLACPQLNLGPIPATESRTVIFPTASVCPFHDELAPTNTAFQGTVAVTTQPVGGPGY